MRRCHGVASLRIAKFCTVKVDGEVHHLTREEAAELREELADAIERRREFVHTVGEHRPDGSYRVARRRATSAGNATVFADFEALWELFRDLPEEFGATDVDRPGVSGSRRHLVVRHLAEHPAFPCELLREQPVTARKDR